MAFELRDYAGGAVETTITAGINATDLSIPLVSATGWPSGGANGPFFVIVDYDVAGKEKIEVASRTGTTLTVASVGKRGIDGTSAGVHASGAKIRHCYTAQDADEANRHAVDTALDHHTQYMRTDGTRHDLTARHSAGTVVPTAVAGTILPDDIAAEGAASTLARSDHKHAITAAVVGTISPDDTAAEGVATSFARSDHRHAITAGTPVAVGTALAEGAGTGFARDNHVHTVGVGSINNANMFAAGVVDVAALVTTIPRGIVARQILATNGAAISVDTDTDFALAGVVVDSTRLYKVTLKSQYFLNYTSGQAVWTFDFHVDGSLDDSFHTIDRTSADRTHMCASILWQPTSGTKALKVRLNVSNGSSSVTLEADADNQRSFFVEDIGLR